MLSRKSFLRNSVLGLLTAGAAISGFDTAEATSTKITLLDNLNDNTSNYALDVKGSFNATGCVAECSCEPDIAPNEVAYAGPPKLYNHNSGVFPDVLNHWDVFSYYLIRNEADINHLVDSYEDSRAKNQYPLLYNKAIVVDSHEMYDLRVSGIKLSPYPQSRVTRRGIQYFRGCYKYSRRHESSSHGKGIINYTVDIYEVPDSYSVLGVPTASRLNSDRFEITPKGDMCWFRYESLKYNFEDDPNRFTLHLTKSEPLWNWFTDKMYVFE